MHRHHWFRSRVVVPVLELLRQGTNPEKLALSLAIGMVLGIFPAVGVTTILVFAVAYILRLNPVAMQLTNYLVYPLQLLLLLPFVRAGEILFRERHLRITIGQIQALTHAGPFMILRSFWTAIWHAVAAWALIAPFAILFVYAVLTPVLRKAEGRFASHWSQHHHAPGATPVGLPHSRD